MKICLMILCLSSSCYAKTYYSADELYSAMQRAGAGVKDRHKPSKVEKEAVARRAKIKPKRLREYRYYENLYIRYLLFKPKKAHLIARKAKHQGFVFKPEWYEGHIRPYGKDSWRWK